MHGNYQFLQSRIKTGRLSYCRCHWC